MTQAALVNSIVAFFSDAKFATIAALILLDFILGVAASFRLGTFRLSYVSDFLRNDVLGKVFPWAVVYVGDKLSHGAGIVAGVDTGAAAMALWLVMVAALGGSIASSLANLGAGNAPTGLRGAEGRPATRRSLWLFGGENAGPPKD